MRTIAKLDTVRPFLLQYSDFVTKNAGAVNQIEQALRSLTYIIPGELAHLPQGIPATVADVPCSTLQRC